MDNFDNSSMTILVADDQEPNRELLSALLTAEGYRVVCAKDGGEALSLSGTKGWTWLC
jgi:CheY-like chemotaxis protein